MGALRNKLESIFEHVYLSRNKRDGSIIVSDKERRETKAINRIQARFHQRINPSKFKQNFLSESPDGNKTLFLSLPLGIDALDETKVVFRSKLSFLFLFFFFLPLPRLVRPISLGRVSSWIPGGIFPGDEASRSAGRLSLANVEGRAKRIKAGAGSGAIIQSSGQLGSIVLIAFHGGRCRQESILSLGLTLSMLHTMSFIINVTGTFQSEGSSTTAEISSPGCSSIGSIDMEGGS